jgi:hypothetical protein
MRTLSCLLILSVGLGLGGCAADSTSASPDEAGEIDELNAALLRASTTLEGTVTAGSQTTVRYKQGDPEYPRAVPYLALEIREAMTTTAKSAGIHVLTGATAANTQEVRVKGLFPGTPRITVVDDNFKVLARSTTVERQADGTSVASVLAPRNGPRLVLIRDQRWSKPMNFDVSVAP